MNDGLRILMINGEIIIIIIIKKSFVGKALTILLISNVFNLLMLGPNTTNLEDYSYRPLVRGIIKVGTELAQLKN